MDLNLPVSVGIVLLIVATGTASLIFSEVMSTSTVLMMVLPSMLGFAAVVFAIGVKHGEYRGTN
jgi:uncharacterized membrane protein